MSPVLPLTAAGAALITAGVIAIWLNLSAALVLVVAGCALVGWVCRDVRRHAASSLARMPLLVHPKVDHLNLVERLRLRITLGPQGRYDMPPCPVEGELTARLVFGRADRERLARHLRKRLEGGNRDVPFTAGRLVLQGRVGAEEVLDFPGPVLDLDGGTETLPVFRAEDPPSSSSWPVCHRYTLPASRDEKEVDPGPIWITPALVSGSDRHALDLDIQWHKVGPHGTPLSLDRIDLLELRFPEDWGKVEQASRRGVQTARSDDRTGELLRMVSFRHLPPSEAELEARRMILSIRFEEEIHREDTVSGRLMVTMNGTLSGFDGVRLYDTLGRSRRVPNATTRTRIEADFELSLASIRYQGTRIVPDHSARNGDGSGYADEFGVIPDDETVIALTNAMSEQGYYIKHVIENPPRSGGRADHVQRFWDIAGRHYRGIYPIDFHMVLTGQEIHRGDIRPERGTTKVQITVRGAYTDDEMSGRIEEEWKALRALTTHTLNGMTPQDASAPAHSAPGPGSAPPWPAVDEGERLRYLRKLDKALLDELITHEEYREMRNRAEGYRVDDEPVPGQESQ